MRFGLKRWFVTLVFAVWGIGFTGAERLAAGPSPTSLRISQNDAYVIVFDKNRPLLQYRYGFVSHKPYIKELFTPAGVQVLRDAPADHLHHHGLMFAVAAGGVSFWVEARETGHQEHRSLENVKTEVQGEVECATFRQELDWTVPGKDSPVLKERRTIEVYRANHLPATLFTWETRLEGAGESDVVELTGAHYYGLGMRFLQALDGTGQFVSATGESGEVVRGEERLVRAKWCAYVSPLGDRSVTIAIFDHPENPRHPPPFFTMPRPFAFFGPTLNLWKEPLKVRAGQSLLLRYGVAICDGKLPAEQIESLYGRWIRLLAATAASTGDR